jgi:hypothetical protein
MFRAVVFTPGRTGSKLIVKNLVKHFNSSELSDKSVTVESNGIVHTHNPLFVPPGDNWIAIMSRRENLFEVVLSTLIGKRTNEFVTYTNKHIEPFSVDSVEFEQTYMYMKPFYELIDTSKFVRVVDIYYEPLVSDSRYFFAQFDIDADTEYPLIKSPYNYYNLIVNVGELEQQFQELESVPIAPDLIESLKYSIQQDLDNIRCQ